MNLIDNEMREITMVEFRELEMLYVRLIIKVLAVFFIVQFLLVYFEYNVFVGLFFCPVIYLFIKGHHSFFTNRFENIEILIHTICYLLIVVVSAIDVRSLSLWLDLIYVIGYSVLMNLQLKKQGVFLVSAMSEYLIRLFWQFVFLAICSLFLQLWECYYGNLWNLSARLIWKETLILNVIFLLFFLIYLKRVTQQMKLRSQENSLVSELAEQIILFFETSEDYLDPKFSISSLASSLGKQKVVVSQAINRELNMSFYLLVAKYRINYAKCMLISKEAFSINMIVKHCGFHSRSTFYKYFELYVGLKPYQYRLKHIGPSGIKNG